MRSIWPLLQQLPTSFEHEGAKRPYLKDVCQRLRLSAPSPFLHISCNLHIINIGPQNQAILNSLSPSVWTFIMDDPKTHNHHHRPRQTWPDTFSWWCWTTDGLRGHAIMTHSLTHSYRNLDMEEKKRCCACARASTSPDPYLHQKHI